MGKLGKKTNGKKDNQMTANEQADESARLVNEAVKINEQRVDDESNAVLALATEIGEELSSHPEFVEAMATAVQAKEDDDYKAIATLKWIEKFVPHKLPLFAWPGSTKEQAEAAYAKLPPDRKPNMLVYDKVVASGGRRGTDSFYKSLVRATPLGKEAFVTLASLNAEDAAAEKKPTDARPQGNRGADRQRANRTISQQLSALRTAAKVYLLMQEIKREFPYIHIEWVRDDSGDPEFDMPEDQDLTAITIDGAGEIVKATKCISIYSKRARKTLVASMATAVQVTIGSFVRWNVERAKAIAIKNNHVSHVWVDDLISSAKQPATTPKTTANAGAQKDKPRAVASWTDLVTNMDAIVEYEKPGDPGPEEVRFKEFKSGFVNGPDETVWSGYQLFILLSTVFADNDLKERARKYDASLKQQLVA